MKREGRGGDTLRRAGTKPSEVTSEPERAGNKHAEVTSEPARATPLPVLFIVGDGRSGSTLLARLLGEVPGVWNMGEAANFVCYDFLRHGVDRCGCGQPLGRCGFWGEVLAETDLPAMVKYARRVRLRHWPRLAMATQPDPASARLLEGLEDLYGRVADRSGGAMVVDSSKSPSLALLLSRATGLELHLIHLVRDPRAAVASWRRPKGYLPHRSLVRVVARWVISNACARQLEGRAASYTLVRYEELVRDPRAVLVGILGRSGMDRPGLDFLVNGGAVLPPSCALAGNPDKWDSGRVAVHYRPWRLAPLMLWACTALLAPWLLRYRYPLGGGRPS